MKKLKIGLIGCGAIGKDHLRRINNLVPNAEIVAVSDYISDVAETIAEKYNIKSFEDGKELIAYAGVDAILIASSDSSHATYVKESIRNKKHVFCEKPLAETSKDCLEIIQMEQSLGKQLVQVGFMRRYDPGYVSMKEIIKSGKIGSPLIVHAAHRNVSQPEGFTTEMGVSNVAIHEIDICRWLLDEEYVSGQVLKVRQSTNSSKGCDNPQIILLETKSGIRIDVEVQVYDAYGYDIQCQVVCENGTVNLPDPPNVIQRSNANYSYGLLTHWKDRFIQAYDIEMVDWVEAVLSNKILGPSAWDGYAACVASDTLNRSRKENKSLKIEMIDKPFMYI